MSSASKPTEDGRRLEAVILKKGIKPIEALEQSACPDLWDSDEDFERWLEELRAIRREGR
jgi:hypothetical protein